MDYPTALKRGWPIAGGIIEGARRHLVQDLIDLTGARWGLDCAETTLELPTLYSHGDFDEYWRDRLGQSGSASTGLPTPTRSFRLGQ